MLPLSGRGLVLENVINAVPVIRHAAHGLLPMPRVVPSAGSASGVAPIPSDIFNAPGYIGMPHVPVGEHSTRLTEADYIVSALYQKIVKYGDVSTANADLEALNKVMSGSIAHADAEHDQRVSNIYLGKALNLLCKLVGQRGALALNERLISTATEACTKVVAARQQFTLENASVIMFHLGELMNHASLQQGCCQTIINHLVPIFDAMLRQHPVHAINGATLAFGLVSALRASEHQLSRRSTGALPRPAADTLLQVVPELLAVQPDLLVAWESRTLALLAKYGVQYLRQLGALGQKRGRLLHAETLQLNAARALKPVIEEARRLSRGIWDQRDTTYRGFTPVKDPRDNMAYSAHYYGRWLDQKPQWMKDRFALQEAERGPLADNPHDGRNFAAVVRQGMQPPRELQQGIQDFPALMPAPAPRPLSAEFGPYEPPAELGRFSQAAGELLRLGEQSDRFDREEAISATNALIISIEAGRTTLNDSQRVQMLLDMDSVCMRLYAADPFDAPQYAWQLQSMRGFLSSQLALVVGLDGRPVMGTDVPFDSGLSSWQRSLLRLLNGQDAYG
ncbi:TPA: hypothetical protein QDZ10_001169 [Stenotrophomonas maltophilia]|nr:hypothetical protein [Stenotrophomonas maltophilia]